jgi:hypothetical protein
MHTHYALSRISFSIRTQCAVSSIFFSVRTQCAVSSIFFTVKTQCAVSSVCFSIRAHCAVCSVQYVIQYNNTVCSVQYIVQRNNTSSLHTFRLIWFANFFPHNFYCPGALYPRFSEIWLWNSMLRFELESSCVPANSCSGLLDVFFCV